MMEERRIERVEIFGYNDNIFFFKFKENDGTEVIGSARTHRIYVNGEKVPPSKLKRSDKIEAFLNGLDKSLPIWAEVLPELYTDHDLETHDEKKVETTVFAPCLWFSHDPSLPVNYQKPEGGPVQKPKEEIATTFKSNSTWVEKIVNKNSEKIVQDYLQKDSTYTNIEAMVIGFSPASQMAQLEVMSAPGLVGKKVVLFANRLFVNGKPRLRDIGKLTDHLRIGLPIYCDLCDIAHLDETKYPLYNTSDLYATLAWIGLKPDLDLVNEMQQCLNEMQNGIVVGLDYNKQGAVIGGAIELTPWSQRNELLKIYFDKTVLYIYGTCMAKANDLEELISNKQRVFVHVGEEILGDDLEKVKTMSLYNNEGTWRKANLVCVGIKSVAELLFSDPSQVFEVPSNCDGLNVFLNNRKISMEKYISIVKGEAKISAPAPPTIRQTDGTEVIDDERYFGRVTELRKPKSYFLGTDTGIMKIESGPLFDRTATFSRANIFIFGQNMSKANLMDIILPDDFFNIEINSAKHNTLTITKAWIGPPPWKPNSNLAANARVNIEFRKWLELHELTEESFFAAASGNFMQRPYFPIQDDVDVKKYQAKLAALYEGATPPSAKKTKAAGQNIGAEFGILQIVGQKEPLEGELVIFENTDVYIHFVHVRNGDMNYLFNEGIKLSCEIREMLGKEKFFWKKKLEVASGGSNRLLAMPKYIANLVYIGSRPKPPTEWKDPASEFEIESNTNLKMWLEKRKVTPGFFSKIIAGEAPPMPKQLPDEPQQNDFPQNQFRPSNEDSWTPAFSRGQQQASATSRFSPGNRPLPVLEDSMNPTASIVQETMKHAQTLLTRVMECVTPSDPKINDVIRSAEDLKLAMFISKTFASAIVNYNLVENPIHSARKGPPGQNNMPGFGSNLGPEVDQFSGRRNGPDPFPGPSGPQFGFDNGQNGVGPGFGNNMGPGNWSRDTGPNNSGFGPNFGPNDSGFNPNFGPNDRGFGPNGGNFGPNGGNLGPNGGNFGPNDGNFGPNGGNFGPNGGNFGPNSGNFGPNGGNFGPNGGNFGPNGGNFGPNGGNFGPNFGPNDGGFNPNFGPNNGGGFNSNFGPNDRGYGPNSGPPGGMGPGNNFDPTGSNFGQVPNANPNVQDRLRMLSENSTEKLSGPKNARGKKKKKGPRANSDEPLQKRRFQEGVNKYF